MEASEKAFASGRLAVDKKAKEVVVLELAGLTDIADFFVAASGTSERHVKTISEGVELGMKEKGITPLSIEGYGEGRWVIIDFGDSVVHVFLDPLRELYDLESLWIEAKTHRIE